MMQGRMSSPPSRDERDAADQDRPGGEARGPVEQRSITDPSIQRPFEDPALLRLVRAH